MKKKILIGLVLLTGLCCIFASTDYYIKNYDVQITVGNDAVHHIVETIDVFFGGPHHGIVREIPLDYRDYNQKTVVKVLNLKCNDQFETDQDNGYLVMKIGSASKSLTGDVRYTIEYDYDIGADFFEGYDLFYMNIIGTEWECPMKKVTFSVTLPYVQDSTFKTEDDFFDYVYENTHFTSGSYGYSGSNLEAYLSQLDGGDLLINGSAENLDDHEGVTIKIDLPEGWYKGARVPWDYRGKMAVANPVVCIILVALAVVLWMLFGKDETPIIVAKFTAPDGFSPLQVGYVADGTVDDKDVISMLFYWADQGLLSIEEKKKDKYEFTKLKEMMDYAVESGRNVPKFEITLFNGFFKNCSVGDKVTFKDLEKNNFFETIQKTKLATRSYFTKSRALQDRKSQAISILVALFSFIPMLMGTLRVGLYEYQDGSVLFYGIVGAMLFFANLISFDTLFRKWYVRKSNVFAFVIRILIPVVFLGMACGIEKVIDGSFSAVQNLISVAGCTAMAFFGIATQRRSKYGNKVLEDILGYREFIDKVEIDQLKMMIESDPDFYYHVLSYAIVLGLEDKWARKFDGMIVNPPTWYTGYSTFDVYYMTRLATRMNRTIPMASVPRSSISGSPGSRIGGASFGGGGFSGGGFGGGGGHAW